MIWCDTRGLWYARALTGFGQPAGTRYGPYGTREQAEVKLEAAQAEVVYDSFEEGGSG